MTQGSLLARLWQGRTFSARSGLWKLERLKQGSPKAALPSTVCGARWMEAVSPLRHATDAPRVVASFRLLRPAFPSSTL